MKRLHILFFVQLCLVGSIFAQTIEYSNIEIEENKEIVKVHKKKYSFATFNYGLYSNDYYSPRHYSPTDDYSFAPTLAHSLGVTFGQVRQWGWYANMQFGTHMQIKENLSEANKDDKTFVSCFSITPGVVVRCVIPLFVTAGVGYGYMASHSIYDDGPKTIYHYDERPATNITNQYYWVVNNNQFDSDSHTVHTVSWEVGLMGILPKNITISAQVAGIGSCVGAKIGIGYAFEWKV